MCQAISKPVQQTTPLHKAVASSLAGRNARNELVRPPSEPVARSRFDGRLSKLFSSANPQPAIRNPLTRNPQPATQRVLPSYACAAFVEFRPGAMKRCVSQAVQPLLKLRPEGHPFTLVVQFMLHAWKGTGSRLKPLSFTLIMTLVLAALPWGHSLYGQQYNGRGGRLQDFVSVAAADTFRIMVTDLKPADQVNFGLIKICINLHHGRTSDLKLTLVNPAGQAIWLSNRNGGETGRNYTETCFSRQGFFGYIHEGENPFNGDYLPDGRFDVLDEGPQPPNGEWQLIVQDLREEVTGILGSWNLYFGTIPSRTTDWCSTQEPDRCTLSEAQPDGALLPDLVMLPSFTRAQFIEYPPDHNTFPRQIKFAATIANIGFGPMETRGSGRWYCGEQAVANGASPCADGTLPRQEILQRIYYKQNGMINHRDTAAGTNYLDLKPGHNHFHVDDWVEYKLLRVTHSGEEEVVCAGEKVSYCLFDSGACQENDPLCAIGQVQYGPQNLPNYGFGRYVNCRDGIQGISVGGYDTYGSMYEGQSLTLPPGTVNGRYVLQITVDPNNQYRESDEDNNVLRMVFHLQKQQPTGEK